MGWLLTPPLHLHFFLFCGRGTQQAYSNEPLRPHTDTTYFSTPCGLQLFHLLLPATISGGHTLLVDGFACANQLSRQSYQILRDTKRTAHAAGTEGYLFRTERGYGVFEEGVDGGLEGVRWNGEDRSGFAGEEDVEGTKRWYDAIREWEGLLRKPENEKWVALEAGTVVGQSFLFSFTRSSSLPPPERWNRCFVELLI